MAERVLIADDEPKIVRLAQITLERSGFTVDMAADGRETLDRVASDRPDIIVLDVMMPHIDGFEVLRRLKADPATAAIPVVMLTAQAKDADILHGTESGAAFYMTKPFNPVELAKVVRKVLDEARGAE